MRWSDLPQARKGQGLLLWEIKIVLDMSHQERRNWFTTKHQIAFITAVLRTNKRLICRDFAPRLDIGCEFAEADDLPLGFWWLRGSWLLGRAFARSEVLPPEARLWFCFWLDNLAQPSWWNDLPEFSFWALSQASGPTTPPDLQLARAFRVRSGLDSSGSLPPGWSDQQLLFHSSRLAIIRQQAYNFGAGGFELGDSVPGCLMARGEFASPVVECEWGRRANPLWVAGYWLMGSLVYYPRGLHPSVLGSLLFSASPSAGLEDLLIWVESYFAVCQKSETYSFIKAHCTGQTLWQS